MTNLSMQSQSAVDDVKATLDEKLSVMSAKERKAAVRQIQGSMKAWIPGDDASKTRIWMILIVGLLILAGLCVIGGTFLASKNKDASALFAAVTGIVGLLVGLFAAPAGAGTDS